MEINWRKWNRVVHRDVGYFFFGMTLIYAISGVALNHMADWNPSYVISRENIEWQARPANNEINTAKILSFLDAYDERENYKKHYFPAPQRLKIFLRSGSIDIDLRTGNGVIEKLKRRAVFFEVNYLHYNPRRLWTWFSDIFCAALVLIAATGLFVLKGKKGITGRGAVLAGCGLVLPIIFLIMYL